MATVPEIIIKALEKDKNFMKPGQRNNDVVDLSIAVFDMANGKYNTFDKTIMGYVHQCAMNLPPEQSVMAETAFKERLQRIRPYLERWYETGDIYNYLTTPLFEYKDKVLEKGVNNE